MSALTAELAAALAEVMRISDRDHVAWDAARAALAKYYAARGTCEEARVPREWTLVPVTPTPEMLDAFIKGWSRPIWDRGAKPVSLTLQHGYEEMLAAAPTPTESASMERNDNRWRYVVVPGGEGYFERHPEGVWMLSPAAAAQLPASGTDDSARLVPTHTVFAVGKQEGPR